MNNYLMLNKIEREGLKEYVNNFKSSDGKQFKFDIAQGSVFGKLQHNLNNHRTDLDIHLNDANASIMSEALFDLKGQVYGLVDGNFILNCSGDTQDKCFKTLSGNGNFKISDGRMPKLGSLEYLLKAGNIIKSGITAISMNSIVELITPLKTGEFSSIDGNIKINHGICNVELHSKGKDLNMFIKGKHNLVTNIADMLVLGQLSRKVSTAFGAVGNLSLNTLFNKIPGVNLSENGQLINELNKIPGIEISNKAYRKFVVEIFGNINNDNNVKSFRWIN